jgi:hypothetical protein
MRKLMMLSAAALFANALVGSAARDTVVNAGRVGDD